MDESFICECGNETFWFFWDRVRCKNCLNEYKQTETSMDYGDADGVIAKEQWLRRYNLIELKYSNWEKSKITYKHILT